MNAVPSDYYISRRNLALALIRARVISDEIVPGSLLPDLETPPLTETLAVSIAHCMQLLVLQENMEFDAVACIRPSAPFTEILARRLGKNDRRCILLHRHGRPAKRHICALDERIPEHVRKVLLVSGYTVGTNPERDAIEFLRGKGVSVSDVLVLVDFDRGAREKLREDGYTLHPIFSAADLREMYKSTGAMAL